MSREAVSCEVLASLAYFELVSLPSKLVEQSVQKQTHNRELRSRLAAKVRRRDAITAHEVVHVTGRRVAARAAIGHEHALARAPEREGRLKTGRPTSDNQHVE